MPATPAPRGAILVTTVVLTGIGLTLALIVTALAAAAFRAGMLAEGREEAFHAAEGGIAYASWRLSHEPGGAVTSRTTWTATVSDRYGGALGSAAVTVDPEAACTGRAEISAIGAWRIPDPPRRAVTVERGRASLARFSFLSDANIWFGGGVVDGPIHANGGIRMDASQNAPATSARATYACGPEHGCASPSEMKPGIWGTGDGGRRGLWEFPVPAFDFSAITVDLAALKRRAQAGGLYLPPSGAYGYLLKFKRNGTVDIHRITHLQPPVWSFNGERWVRSSDDISGAPVAERTYAIPAGCGDGNLIVAEDTVWVEGEVSGRASVVAARFPETPSTAAPILLSSSLTLVDRTRDAIALLAQGDIRFPLVIPDTVTIEAVLIAQHGRIIRNFYPDQYRPWYLRETLSFRGSLITRKTAATTWVDRTGNVTSGFRRGTNTFDARFIDDPPPFLPVLGEPRLLEFRERLP